MKRTNDWNMVTWVFLLCALILAAALLGGCAICDRHPTGCAVTAVVATAVIVGAAERRREPVQPAPPPPRQWWGPN